MSETPPLDNLLHAYGELLTRCQTAEEQVSGLTALVLDVTAERDAIARQRDILWSYLNRDQKCDADTALEEAGLPSIEGGYRVAAASIESQGDDFDPAEPRVQFDSAAEAVAWLQTDDEDTSSSQGTAGTEGDHAQVSDLR